MNTRLVLPRGAVWGHRFGGALIAVREGAPRELTGATARSGRRSDWMEAGALLLLRAFVSPA